MYGIIPVLNLGYHVTCQVLVLLWFLIFFVTFSLIGVLIDDGQDETDVTCGGCSVVPLRVVRSYRCCWSVCLKK